MANLWDIWGRLKLGYDAVKNANTIQDMEQNLDRLIKSGELNNVIMDAPEIQKEIGKVKNNLKIFRTTSDLATFHSTTYSRAFNNIFSRVKDLEHKNTMYPHGDPARDFVLSEFWKNEPILAGAVYSMAAKMSTLSWTVTGTVQKANYFARIYTDALSMNRDGGWGDFVDASAQDFYTTDRGTFWVTPRTDAGILTELGTVDALSCALTGNAKRPMFYSSWVTGQDKYFKYNEFAHFSSLTSPREELFGIGYCAVSRAYKAARILMGLSDYDWEKLNNMPPEGVAAVSGLTMDEFQDSLTLWRTAREQNKSLTYPQVLWLLGTQPNTKVSVDFVGFSEVPESFDRSTVIDQYVNTLALVFGVDAREFWPISSSSLGTASESEIQHMKAKGKGPGELVGIIERYLNRQMPDGCEFGFDTQDIGEDATAAEIAKTWIAAFMPLYNPGGSVKQKQQQFPGKDGPKETPTGVSKQEGNEPPKAKEEGQKEGGEGDEPKPLIDQKQFLRLLVDRGVLPNWIVQDKKVVRTDTGLIEKQLSQLDPSTEIAITWKAKDGAGVWEIERLPAVELFSSTPSNSNSNQNLPAAIAISTTPSNNGTTQIPSGENGNLLDRLKQLADELIEDEIERNIRGKPLPENEALRGPRPTKNSLMAEIKRWQEHPILRQYVPQLTEREEIAEIVGSLE